MDTNKLKDPTFVIACVTLLLVVGLHFSNRQFNARLSALESAALVANQSASVANQAASVVNQEAESAISQAKSQIADGDFAGAYDSILVASRLAPSDNRILALVIEYVDKTKSEDDEVEALADDLLGRAESLIHYQPPSGVAIARAQFNAAVKQAVPEQASKESPLDDVRDSLSVAENADQPTEIRLRAAEQARNALDDAMFAIAFQPAKEDQERKDEFVTLRLRLDEAEQACLASSFLPVSENAKKWIADAQSLLKEAEDAPLEKVPDFSKRMGDSSDAGIDRAQEVRPYARPEFSGGAELLREIESQIKRLQRTKVWLYNQQVVRRIREVESQKDWTAKDKISSLAEVNEELLAPYVLRRHNETWDKAFDKLKDDDKLWAVRLRILQVKE